jgi:predicted phosphoribosyltransferase
MPQRLHDRAEAGRLLANKLEKYANRTDVLILALPRGGVPVAFEVARRLRAPLDVLVVRKLGVPGHEELAMGAIASGGARVINEDVVRQVRIPPWIIERVTAVEAREVERREQAYREGRPPPPVEGRTIILVDDGLATGSTMIAAAKALRPRGPAHLVVAAGVCAPESCATLSRVADECVCALQPPMLDAVGKWYEDFSQTQDSEVRALLERAARELEPATTR